MYERRSMMINHGSILTHYFNDCMKINTIKCKYVAKNGIFVKNIMHFSQ